MTLLKVGLLLNFTVRDSRPENLAFGRVRSRGIERLSLVIYITSLAAYLQIKLKTNLLNLSVD